MTRFAKKSPLLLMILMLVCTITLISCGQGSNSSVSTPTPTPKPTLQPMPTYLPGNGTLALYDPLTNTSGAFPNNGPCIVRGGAYHVKADKGGYYYKCLGGNSFANFATEIRVTVLEGLCGGMMVRADDANNKYYLFEICSNADYGVFQYFGKGANDYKTIKLAHSTAITSGQNQQNVLAIVANENMLTLYVNKQLVERFSLSQGMGKIGLVVDSSGVLGGSAGPTEVAYADLKVWVL